MKFRKRIIAYFLTMCMVFMMIPGVPARAEDVIEFSGTWSELCSKLQSSCSIKLMADVTGPGSDALMVDSDATVILDLNGHTINRNLSSADSGGYVFIVFGNLTINDSAGGGKITGGNNKGIGGNSKGNGGGISVSSGGIVTLNGGSITGNTAEYGGGVHNIGTFNMTGGSITGNTASEDGGGISQYSNSVSSSANIIISGGTISSNTAKNGGGIYHGIGNVVITGGTITENTASANGGGIYWYKHYVNNDNVSMLDDSGSKYAGANITKNKATLGGGIYYAGTSSFSLLEGGSIKNNTATSKGGGIYIPSGNAVSAGGKLVVTGNKASGSNNNVYLASSTTSKAKLMLSSSNKLLEGSSICVTLANPAVKDEFVSDGASDDLAGYFSTDVSGTHVCHTDGKMLCHNLKAIAKVAPTATTYGCKAYWQCETCNKYYSDAYGEKKISNLSTWKKTAEASGGGQIAKTGGASGSGDTGSGDAGSGDTGSGDAGSTSDSGKVLAKGKTVTDNKTNAKYKVTVSSATKGEVAYTTCTNKNAKTVNIPATVTINNVKYKVTSVAAKAFKGNNKLTKVVIGSNVKKISDKAFYGCKKLKSVTLNSKLTTIGASAFYKCVALTKITIPAKVTTIGKNAFCGCKKLKTITIKTKKLTAKKVGANAFKGINASAKVKVPSSKLKAYKTLLKAKGIKGKKQKITK